jgi:hypothetical protein
LDYEACLAYLVFPPIGGILLLILERKSDYVRYVVFLFLGHDDGGWGANRGPFLQISRVAVESALHGAVCRAFALLVVGVPQLAVFPRRSCADRMVGVECVPRCGYVG